MLSSSSNLSNSHDKIAVIIPVYLNEATLEKLAARVVDTLSSLNLCFEIVFINDGSTDGSARTLDSLQKKHTEIHAITQPVNSGQQNAVRLGLKRTNARFFVVMDADLQDPPEAITTLFYALLNTPNEAVFAQRTEQYQNKRRMFSSKAFKWLVRRIVNLPPNTGCFLIMTDSMTSRVLSFETKRFYLPGLVAKSGLPIGTVGIEREYRAAGESSYRFMDRLSVAYSNIRCLMEKV